MPDVQQLIRRNRLPRKQRGERIETKTAWCLRYHINGKQKSITLAQKGSLYRSWNERRAADSEGARGSRK